jgi:hypothetical protein
MSSPTPGSDPNFPQGGAPQGQPGWSAPQGPPPGGPQGYDPAPSYSGAPAGHGGPGAQRPGQVTAAAIIGIVIGALGILSVFGLGLIFAFDAVLGVLSLLSVVAAVVLLVGGIQAIQGKSPQLLLLGSYASIGVQLLTLIWAMVSGWGFLFAGVLGFILPIVIVVLLRQPVAKQHYAARGISY